ncbi:MAG: hypothetical protein HY763_08875 [Planctomycetes bacterium]|nr:hypothetical protein [Planctomycetota bacterium]
MGSFAVHSGRFAGPRRAVGVLGALLLLGGFAAPALAVPGDADANAVVDLRDLLRIRNEQGTTGAPGFSGADADNNGVVDHRDLTVWRQNFPFIGTPQAPYIAVAAPADDAVIGNRRPTIIVDYSPTSLSLDTNSLVVMVDGVDQSASTVRGFRGASLPVVQSLGDGVHTIMASIADVNGTAAQVISHFTVTSLLLAPKAVPQSGSSPLNVRFTPDVIWADVTPTNYLWDWDANGVWDNGCPGCGDLSARPDVMFHTFLEEGVHIVKFGVYQQGTNTLTTLDIPIAVTETFASASPSNGPAPLTVFLHGVAADLADPITLYEWDFDYNGTFAADYSSTANPNTARIYTQAGVYHPVFRATHQSGAKVEHPIVLGEVRVNASAAPTAIAAAAQGASALTVNFSGNGSDNGSIVLYEWDFDNDGTFDYTSPTNGDTSHTYATAGVKIAALRVRDNDGNTSVDRVRVDTRAPATLEVLDDTVAVESGDQSEIRTTLSIASTVWLYIRSADGRQVRTLVDHELRAAGTYNDVWDGRDFRFEPTHPGAYYAVLQWSYPGRTEMLDLADTTGGNQYFAQRLSTDPSRICPYGDDFWQMTYRIPSASRASLYILPGGSNRTDTPFDNLALGAGDYTYYWAGLDANNQLVPFNFYLWSVNAWTLGDNAVVVTGIPQITMVDIDVGTLLNQFSPTDRGASDPEVDVSFTIDKRSTVIVKVISLDTGVALRAWDTGYIDPGVHSLVWDGRAQGGEYLSPGYYRFSFIAVDERGNASLERDAIIQFRY